MEGLVPPLLLVGMLLFFWLLVIRPGVRRERDRRAMQSALQVGDRVVLTSGFFGSIVAVHDDRAEIELAPGTVVTVALGAVGGLADDVMGATGPTDPASGSTVLDKTDPGAPRPSSGTEES